MSSAPDAPAAPPPLLSEDQLSGRLFRRWNLGAAVIGLLLLVGGGIFLAEQPRATPGGSGAEYVTRDGEALHPTPPLEREWLELLRQVDWSRHERLSLGPPDALMVTRLAEAVDVEVPAGTFSCAHLQTRAGQPPVQEELWIARSGRRAVVRFRSGGRTGELQRLGPQATR